MQSFSSWTKPILETYTFSVFEKGGETFTSPRKRNFELEGGVLLKDLSLLDVLLKFPLSNNAGLIGTINWLFVEKTGRN